MYVDFVDKLDEKDEDALAGYPFQAAQVQSKKHYHAPPFRIDTAFRKAFLAAYKKFGRKRLELNSCNFPPKFRTMIALELAK